jgi:4-carboxymuconolactone decarboxylase
MVDFPKLRRGDLNEEQRALWDDIVQGPRKATMGQPTAELGGPFNAWLQIPSFGRIGSRMGERLRFGSILPGDLRELAILTVGAHWKADYEFWAHARMARQERLAEAIIEALRTDAPPPYENDRQRLVHLVARDLLHTGRVGEALHAEASAALGYPGLVEVVALVGYYCLVSFTLNTADARLPEGEPPVWP